MLPGVSKTAILTLRARADEHERSDALFDDPKALAWFNRVAWPEELDSWYRGAVPSFFAFRAHEYDRLLRRQFEHVASPVVVELGCGLSTRRFRLQDACSQWTDLDLEPVIELRKKFGVPPENMISASVTEDWMSRIDASPEQLFILAEGLLYYLPRAAVDDCFTAWRRAFPGAYVIFDVVGRRDFKSVHARSQAVGTPMQWALQSGIAKAFEEFGIDVVPGWEPDVLLKETVELYIPRFGKAATFAARWASKMRSIADHRSGVIAGRLRPLAKAGE